MYVIGHPFCTSYGMRAHTHTHTHTRVHTRFFIRIYFVESSVYLYLLTQLNLPGSRGDRGSDGGAMVEKGDPQTEDHCIVTTRVVVGRVSQKIKRKTNY